MSRVRGKLDFSSDDDEENPKRKRQKVLDREVPEWLLTTKGTISAVPRSKLPNHDPINGRIGSHSSSLSLSRFEMPNKLCKREDVRIFCNYKYYDHALGFDFFFLKKPVSKLEQMINLSMSVAKMRAMENGMMSGNDIFIDSNSLTAIKFISEDHDDVELLSYVHIYDEKTCHLWH